MLLKAALGITLALFSTLVVSAPLDAIQMGSKHNLYLVTCTRRSIPDCPLLILCSRQQQTAETTYTAVAYYANGPIESSRNTNPTQIEKISQPKQPWEGVQRSARITWVGEFSSSIDAGAAALPKGQIAGSAKLGAENFVCFKDGQSSFVIRDDLDLLRDNCLADYWCPSIQV